MQLIRNCTGEIRAKTCNCDLIGCFCYAKVIIVHYWIILADDDSITFDFRTPSSIFYISILCFFSLMLYDSVIDVFSVFGWFKKYFEFIDRTYHVYRPILKWKTPYSTDEFNEICTKLHLLQKLFGEVCLTQECFHSGFYTGFLEMWNYKHYQADLALTFLVLEFTKHKHTVRISYTVILPRRNVPVVRIGIYYCTVLSSITTVKLQKQLRKTQQSWVSKNRK